MVFVFGNVNYYFITSTGTNCKLFPDGQQVKLEGQSYLLHIIPDNTTDVVTLADNGTQQVLEREDGVDKNNNPAVSYSYRLTNINAAHNLVITSAAAASADLLFVKSQNS